MDTIWKWIMHLNARAFCLVTAIILLAMITWCSWRLLAPPTPFQHGDEKLTSEQEPCAITALDYVSEQLAGTILNVPTDPFRPTLEAIFTNDAQRAAFIKALKDSQARLAGQRPGEGGGQKEDPFAHLRRDTKVPDGAVVAGAEEHKIIPKLTFLGFMQRPDGTKAALFHNSLDNSTIFYDAGQQKIQDVEIIDADIRQAQIRFPDGAVRSLEIGKTVELAAVPDPNKPATPAPQVAPRPRPAVNQPPRAAGERAPRGGARGGAQRRPAPNF